MKKLLLISLLLIPSLASAEWVDCSFGYYDTTTDFSQTMCDDLKDWSETMEGWQNSVDERDLEIWRLEAEVESLKKNASRLTKILRRYGIRWKRMN